MLDFWEAGWAQIRYDMLQEINAYAHLHLSVYGSAESVEEIRQSLNHSKAELHMCNTPFLKYVLRYCSDFSIIFFDLLSVFVFVL